MSKQSRARQRKLLGKKNYTVNPVHTNRRYLGECPNCGYAYASLHEKNMGICDCPKLHNGNQAG
jgi:hypothetical protein